MMQLRWALGGTIALMLVLLLIRYSPRADLASGLPISQAVVDQQGALLRLSLAADDQYRLWTPLESVSEDFVDALLLHEDQNFYYHPGVDPLAVMRAVTVMGAGGPRQGASTLTMQFARLYYRLNTRSISGKLRQMMLALWLEARYSKREILEAHLNLLPYGGNLQGVGTASLIYFEKPASRLSLAEALSLVLIPQAPVARHPHRNGSSALLEARQRLFARWLEHHPTDQKERGLMALPLNYRKLDALPFEAPHLVDHLLQQHPGVSHIQTTLSLPLQRRIEREIEKYLASAQRVGMRNAVAMLVDWRDMSVKSLVGSARYSDGDIHGQVNGAFAKRSPGSTLKPFLYGLAMDQGLIHPKTMLKDAPTAFGPFRPENFDGAFVGPIDATQALIRSRNVPAVALSSTLASPDLHDFLKAGGVRDLASKQHYGLALILGAGEISMEEALRLYALLPNRGHLRPLRYLQDDPPAEFGKALLSEEASYLLIDMLRENPRPDDLVIQGVGSGAPVAWKTGTSWGFRDAWTIGIFGPYVLAVWVGEFDGRSNPAFVGVRAAAPLFFHLVDALRSTKGYSEPARKQPPNLSTVEVCAASGGLPNRDCPRTVKTGFVPGVSPIKLSTVHRRIAVDRVTGRQACAPFSDDDVRWESHEFWSSDLMRLFALAGLPRRQPPPPGDCIAGQDTQGVAPQIVSPLAGVRYSFRQEDEIDGYRLPLNAHAGGDMRSIYWFIDNAFVGRSAPGVALAWAPQRSGRFEVRAVDEAGRADQRPVHIEFVQ